MSLLTQLSDRTLAPKLSRNTALWKSVPYFTLTAWPIWHFWAASLMISSGEPSKLVDKSEFNRV